MKGFESKDQEYPKKSNTAYSLSLWIMLLRGSRKHFKTFFFLPIEYKILLYKKIENLRKKFEQKPQVLPLEQC